MDTFTFPPALVWPSGVTTVPVIGAASINGTLIVADPFAGVSEPLFVPYKPAANAFTVTNGPGAPWISKLPSPSVCVGNDRPELITVTAAPGTPCPSGSN